MCVRGCRREREMTVACILDGMESPSVVDCCQGDPIVMTAGPADQLATEGRMNRKNLKLIKYCVRQ